MFAILQKYDFSSKSQHRHLRPQVWRVVCDTAKVRFFKQITTVVASAMHFASCLRYCKSTIFQANHNPLPQVLCCLYVVCDTAKVRFFKQITTWSYQDTGSRLLFAILQKYDFSSKSQRLMRKFGARKGCLRYCKSTIFQANHNFSYKWVKAHTVVCDTAKVRFFKQITTETIIPFVKLMLFAILQKYDFSSKSQPAPVGALLPIRCLRYCKSTIFQANHNPVRY